MRITLAILGAFAATPALLAAAPCVAQAPPAVPAPPPPNPYQGLWTSWTDAARDSVEAEAQGAESAAPGAQSIGTSSTLASTRTQEQAEALGARVGDIVRGGDCAGGERIAREAGDFPLVQAVRAYCHRGEALRR